MKLVNNLSDIPEVSEQCNVSSMQHQTAAGLNRSAPVPCQTSVELQTNPFEQKILSDEIQTSPVEPHASPVEQKTSPVDQSCFSKMPQPTVNESTDHSVECNSEHYVNKDVTNKEANLNKSPSNLEVTSVHDSLSLNDNSAMEVTGFLTSGRTSVQQLKVPAVGMVDLKTSPINEDQYCEVYSNGGDPLSVNAEESNSVTENSCVFVKEEFIASDSDSSLPAFSESDLLRTNSLNQFQQKSRDLIQLLKTVGVQLEDSTTANEIKVALTLSLEKIIKSFFVEFKQSFLKDYFISFVINLFEEALKLKEKIPHSLKSQFINPILDFLLPILKQSLIVKKEPERAELPENDSRFVEYGKQIRSIANKYHSESCLQLHCEKNTVPDVCLDSSENEASGTFLERIYNTFSNSLSTLHKIDNYRKETLEHLNSLGSNKCSLYNSVTAASLDSSTAVTPSSVIAYLSKIASASTDSAEEAAADIGVSASGVFTEDSQHPLQFSLPGSKKCLSPGCNGRVTHQDPHDLCVVHASCTKTLVFIPCDSCYLLFNKLATKQHLWRDIFTYRFDQLKCYRKRRHLKTNIVYVNSHVERQFEIFDSALTFDNKTVYERVVQNSYLNTLLHQGVDLDASSVAWDHEEISGQGAMELLIGNRNNVKRRRSKKIKSSTESQTKKTCHGKPTCEKTDYVHNNKVTMESLINSKISRYCKSLDPEAGNSELSSLDSSHSSNDGGTSDTVEERNVHDNDTRTSDKDESANNLNDLSPDPTRQQQHMQLSAMLALEPTTWDVDVIKTAALPYNNRYSPELQKMMRQSFQKYVECMQEGLLGDALQEADIFLQCFQHWEGAYVMVAMALYRLGIRSRAEQVCHKAIRTLSHAPVMLLLLDKFKSEKTESVGASFNLMLKKHLKDKFTNHADKLTTANTTGTNEKEITETPLPAADPLSNLSKYVKSEDFVISGDIPERPPPILSRLLMNGVRPQPPPPSSIPRTESLPSIPPYSSASSIYSGDAAIVPDVDITSDLSSGIAASSSSDAPALYPSDVLPPRSQKKNANNAKDVIAALIQKSASIKESSSKQKLKEDSVCLISDEKLLSLTVRQLNKLFRGLPPYLITILKQRRRTLKNRGYAYSCRLKRKTVSETLEFQCSKLNHHLKEVVKENLYLRCSNKLFRKGYQEVLSRLLAYEPEYLGDPQLRELLSKPEPPPSLMPADCFRAVLDHGANMGEEDSGDESVWVE